tara:strand:+ start:33 stop:638 length:606 start_codon:yes stop_codon:yes gene_type:complete
MSDTCVRIEGKLLQWDDVWDHLKMTKTTYNRGTNKWIATDNTPEEVVNFLNDFGYVVKGDTRNFVGFNSNQLAVVVLNNGFAKYLCECLPSLAIEIGIATSKPLDGCSDKECDDQGCPSHYGREHLVNLHKLIGKDVPCDCEADVYCNICEGGLSVCDVCNGAESCLPTECPGEPIADHQKTGVSNGDDFINGEWEISYVR